MSIRVVAAYSLAAFIILLGTLTEARAEFVINSAVLEFISDGPRQQDIELFSQSKTSDYIVSEIFEVQHPGAPDERRQRIDDPALDWLLVTPDKSILTPGSRKILRFVLLKDPDTAEHIFRVTVKPVIKGVDSDKKVGLKILVGYEVLVIVRPMTPRAVFTAARHGRSFEIVNNGNTNILLQNGHQCQSVHDCKLAPVVRAYAGQKTVVDLPQDLPVTYSIWDGANTMEKQFD